MVKNNCDVPIRKLASKYKECRKRFGNIEVVESIENLSDNEIVRRAEEWFLHLMTTERDKLVIRSFLENHDVVWVDSGTVKVGDKIMTEEGYLMKIKEWWQSLDYFEYQEYIVSGYINRGDEYE